jgi:hypothetical protein
VNRALAFLRRPRRAWVDLEVRVEAGRAVRSHYTTPGGELLRVYFSQGSELASGLSIVHDIKDHILYGLSFTPLAEIQTVVQQHVGRELNEAGDEGLGRHIFMELFAPGGGLRVYEAAGEAGMLDVFLPGASGVERQMVFAHMLTLAEQVMRPALRRLYLKHEPARRLQIGVRDQPALVRELLAGVKWCDRRRLLLRLADNAGFATRVRAFIDPELAEVSAGIAREIDRYVARHRLAAYGRLFDTEDYLLPLLGSVE